jgi:hypothetical protein
LRGHGDLPHGRIMTLDDMMTHKGAMTPIDMLENWFFAHGWSHERNGDEEVVAGTQGAWGQYELRGIWREDERVLQFLAFPDIRVNDSQFAGMYETIALINEQLWLGHFELWTSNGSLVYRHALLLEEQEDAMMSSDQTDILIDTAVGELDRFYPVFQFVLWGGKTPAEAIAAAMVETAGEA